MYLFFYFLKIDFKGFLYEWGLSFFFKSKFKLKETYKISHCLRIKFESKSNSERFDDVISDIRKDESFTREVLRNNCEK